jgi:hypothetical protein
MRNLPVKENNFKYNFFQTTKDLELNRVSFLFNQKKSPEILFVTSYPPRECGIATYSQDLIQALKNKFSSSFTIRVAALETNHEKHSYSNDVDFILNTDLQKDYF